MVGWNEEDQKTRLIKFGVTHYELPGAQLKKIACPIRPPVIFIDHVYGAPKCDAFNEADLNLPHLGLA